MNKKVPSTKIISTLFQKNNVDELLKLVHTYGFEHIKSTNGNNTLHYACEANNTSMINSLIDNGADIYLRNNDGELPFHYCFNIDNLKIFLDLNVDVNIKDNFGCSVLNSICRYELTDVVEFLISHNANVNLGNSYGDTPLHAACSTNSFNVIKILINHKADINIKNQEGDTPLHVACSWEALESMELLLSLKDIKINAQNNKKNTPLHLACTYDHIFILQLLLKHNADITLVNINAQNPLDLAVANEYHDCVAVLNSYQKYNELNESISSFNNNKLVKKIKL